MATYIDLAQRRGVKIRDKISFPLLNPTEKGYDPSKRHTATIVGPSIFPDCTEVYLAPPKPTGGNIYLYNPATDRLSRRRELVEGEWRDKIPGAEEIVVQTIHDGYDLLEKA